jgi:hypothetical protein
MHSPSALAQQQTSAQDAQALQRQIVAAEARARELERRVELLERRLNELRPAEAQAKPAASPTASVMQAQAPRPAPPAAPPAPAVSVAQAERKAPRPGSFEVDEDAAQRALERTLTQQGALLLPAGGISLTPAIGYTRTERDQSALANVTDPATGATSVVTNTSNLRRNEFAARLDMRMGLPMDSQLEVGLPFQYVRSSSRDMFGNEISGTGNGAGDLTIGLAKTLMRERGAAPDLIGRVTLNTGTGRRSDDQVALNSGYRQLAAELVALKRQDPLAFFGGISYAHSFEKNGIRPGAVTGLTLGTVLAASPATSLQFGFTQTYREKQRLNGNAQVGTDETYGTVNIGASSILSRDVMVTVTTGIGVGADAPRYSFNVAFPITFR